MWIVGVRRGKTSQLCVSKDAVITKTGLRTVSDLVNWIRVMQAFGGEILCMLMYASVSVKTNPNGQIIQTKNGQFLVTSVVIPTTTFV